MLAAGLTLALVRAGIPVVGVSIGRETDRATWIVFYAVTATDAQRTAGAALVATYDVAADAALQSELADRALDFRVVKALARATWEQLPAGKPSWTDFLARWKALYLAG